MQMPHPLAHLRLKTLAANKASLESNEEALGHEQLQHWTGRRANQPISATNRAHLLRKEKKLPSNQRKQTGTTLFPAFRTPSGSIELTSAKRNGEDLTVAMRQITQKQK